MLITFLIGVMLFGSMYLGYYDSRNTEGLGGVKTVLGPLLNSIGWVDEQGRGLIFRQSLKVRIILASLVGVVLMLVDAFLITNSETSVPYLLLQEIDTLAFGTLAVLIGLIFSYLWKPLENKAKEIGDKAAESVKGVVDSAPALEEKLKPDTLTVKPEPEKVEVKTEEVVEEPLKKSARQGIEEYLNKGKK